MNRKEYYDFTVKTIDDNREAFLSTPNLTGFGIELNEKAQAGDNPFQIKLFVSQVSDDKKAVLQSLGNIPVVVEKAPEIQELNGDSTSPDEGTYNPLEGGIQLTYYDKDSTHCGTLGCFVMGENDTVYGLTNRHVAVSEGTVLYHPEKKSCCCDCCVTGAVGTVKKVSGATTTDSAIIELDKEVKWKNEIVKIGVVKGESSLAPEELLGQIVRKRGRTTLLTKGKITISYYESTPLYTYKDQILILGEDGKAFAEGGDSGSVVVDKDDKVLALLWGKSGNSGVCNLIRPVLNEMGVSLISESKNGTGTLSRATTRMLASGLHASTPEVHTTLTALINRHASEVMQLVNHSRPVTVAWQRMKGPQYVQPLINAFRFPEQPLDSLLTDGTWIEVLKKMEVALHNNGSYRLRADLSRYREMILKEFSLFVK